MKKTLAGILAVLMILCMGTTVFAATSPTGEDVIFDKISNSASAVPGQGNVNVGKVSKETYEEAKKETVGSIVSMTEVKLNNVTNTDLSKGVSVSLSVSTLTADDSLDTIRIMHKRSSDGKWEIITPLAVDPITKTVTLKMYEFSPLAIIRYEAGKAPDSTQNIPPGNNNNIPVFPPSNGGSSGNTGNNSGNNSGQNNTIYDQVSTSLKALEGEQIINVSKVDKNVYEEAVKETTGNIVSMANISLKNVANTNISKGVAVSVYVSSLIADDSVNTIRLLHKRSNDNKWELIIPTSVNPSTKTITATFYDFSPVAVVRYSVGNAPASTQYIPAGSVDTPSDNTPVDDPDDSGDPEDPEDPEDPNYGDGDYGDYGDYGDGGDDVVRPDDGQHGNSTQNQTKPVKKPAATVHVSSTGISKKSPKTGAEVPVLPAVAMFSLMGIAYCGKKAKCL